jgi:hypothetical protein
MTTVEGGCFCGAIRYRIEGRPSNSMVCHCKTCRRVAAAPAVAWVTFGKRSFAIVKGKPVEFRSSPPVRRTFCPACGTQLTYVHDNQKETLDVTTCSLDDPAAFPPTHHSWLSHNVPWVRFGDGLPGHQQAKEVTS